MRPILFLSGRQADDQPFEFGGCLDLAGQAAERGFEDPVYFSRFFKRRTGLSPQRYREVHRVQA